MDAYHMSRGMRFSTMWYVWPAKPQISLRIHTVWPEPLLVTFIFYECLATGWPTFGDSKLKRRLHRLVWVYTCQNATLLEMLTICLWSAMLCFCARCHKLTASFCSSWCFRSPWAIKVLKSSRASVVCLFWVWRYNLCQLMRLRYIQCSPL